MSRFAWQEGAGFRIKTLSSILEQTVSELWPNIKLDALFYPLADKTHGDVGSDLPRFLAGILKLSEYEITSTLLKKLPPVIPYIFCVYEGFLNLKLDIDFKHQLEPNSVDLNKKVPLAIFVTPPNKEFHGWAFIRLVSLALVHRRMLRSFGYEVEFYVGPDKILSHIEEQHQQHWQQILSMHNNNHTPAKQSHDQLKNFISAGGRKQIFLWANREIWRRKELTNLRQNGDLIFQFPRRNWFSLSDFYEPVSILNSFGANELLSCQLYLASDLSMEDLDLFVPTAAERANLLWYFDVTLKRVENLLLDHIYLPDQGTSDIAQDGTHHHLSLYKELVVNIQLLPGVVQDCALMGNIWGALRAIVDTLDHLNSTINRPDFRSELLTPHTKSPQSELLRLAHKNLPELKRLFGSSP